MNQIPLNDLGRIDASENELIKHAISQVINSGNFILGGKVAAFESELGEFLGARHVMAVASGTDALVIALRALGVSRGHLVATTPNAGGYTSTALQLIGAQPLFVDCDDFGQMSPESLRDALSLNPQTHSVVVTHLFGLGGHIEEIAQICAESGLLLVEDCAQSLGASRNGMRFGTFGAASTFSFYPTKNLGALGDAGAISTPDPLVAERVRSLRQYGWSERYKVEVTFGQNSRMDEFQAAVLTLRLPKLDALNVRRRAIWALYEKALAGSDFRMIGVKDESFVAHLAVIKAPLGKRERARLYLGNLGVSTGIHYPILDYQQPAFASEMPGSCPVAEDLVDRIFTVPLFPDMTDEEILAVVSGLKAISAGDF